jgi:hypothetical protein
MRVVPNKVLTRPRKYPHHNPGLPSHIIVLIALWEVGLGFLLVARCRATAILKFRLLGLRFRVVRSHDSQRWKEVWFAHSVDRA